MSDIYTPEYRIFIQCLKDCRIRSKMSQQELASNLGYSQSYISKYEQGQKRLDLLETRAICIELGLSLSEFVKEYEERLTMGGL